MSKKNKIINLGDITANKMTIKFQRDLAMPTIFEALIEIITNSDDAYEKLHGSLKYCGDLRIEYFRGGKKNPTVLKVKDKACGLSFEEMKDKFLEYHKRTSTTSRSFFGRGLRDVTALGDVKVSSLHNGLFSEVIMKKDLSAYSTFQNAKPNKEILKNLGVKKSGTTVEVIIPAGSKSDYNPYAETIIKHLPRHYALSRILDEKNKTINLKFVDSNKGTEHKLLFFQPNGELVFEKEFVIDKYSTRSKFKLFRLKDILDESYADTYKTTGIAVYGKKTCFQKNFLDKSLDKEQLAFRYYGYLECPFIDELMDVWHKNEAANKMHDSLNDSFVLNPTRLEGMKVSHPFVKELFKEPVRTLIEFINKDKKKFSLGNDSDEKLSKLMNEMIKDCADLLNDIDREETSGNEKGALGTTEWRAIPSGLKILVGQEKNISIYTFKENISKGNKLEIVINEKDKKFIEIEKQFLELSPTKNDNKKYVASLKIKGVESREKIDLLFRYNNQIKTQAKIEVYLEKNRNFIKDIEFEKREYNVIRDGNRKIKIFAKYPEIINEENLSAKILIDDISSISGPKTCNFKIISDTNYAVSEISIKGLKLESKTKITALTPLVQDSSIINVVFKEEENQNPYQWDVNPHDLGPNRAAWDITNPNLLKISSKHPSIKKYLGSDKKPYPYSETPMFKLLLVEILAEKFAEKRVDLIATNNPIEYSDVVKYKQPHEILQQAIVYFEKAKSKFIENLHSRWFKDEEIRKINSNQSYKLH
jgi:hypothetical protein